MGDSEFMCTSCNNGYCAFLSKGKGDYVMGLLHFDLFLGVENVMRRYPSGGKECWLLRSLHLCYVFAILV